MKKTIGVILFLFFANICFAQFVIPTKSGKDFEKGYYHLPLKLVVKGMWKASAAERKEMVEVIKDFGFTDTIILITPPEYPNKAYRDSIDIICKNAKVGSAMEISFKSFINSWYGIGKLETNYITMMYKAYDYVNSQPLLPGITFGAGSFASVKKMFIKAVPNTK